VVYRGVLTFFSLSYQPAIASSSRQQPQHHQQPDVNERGEINLKSNELFDSKDKKLIDLDTRKIYVMTECKMIHTRYGQRLKSQFDEDFTVFMPPRFAVDWETYGTSLTFMVRDPVDGSYIGKPFAKYTFVVPKPNGCICDIPILWTLDEDRHSLKFPCACKKGTCENQFRICPCVIASYGRARDKINNLNVFLHVLGIPVN
jgi:hypothetical protein